jgi:hypothetical protein
MSARRWRSSFELCRTVSCDGVCAIDVAREPARHRGDSLRQCEQTLRDGLAQHGASLYVGRRQRVARLAHLGRRSRLVDQACTQTLQRHGLGRFGSEQRGVCVGRNDDRPLFEPARLGAISQSQGCSQTAHVVGSAWRYPSVYPYQRRQDARSQRARLLADRARRLLCHGPRVSGFRTTLRNESDRCVLCDSCQDKHERQTSLLATHRSKYGRDLRSIGAAQRLLCYSTLPRESAQHSFQRPRDRKDPHILDQQFCTVTADGFRGILQMQLMSFRCLTRIRCRLILISIYLGILQS